MVTPNQLKAGDALLSLEDLHMYFGRVGALAGISLEVSKGEIHRDDELH